MLEKLQTYTTAIEEEQYCQLEARVNITTPMTCKVETSKAENYGVARPLSNLRAKPTSYTQSTLAEEAVVQPLKSQLETRWDQTLELCAALLRDRIFGVIPGTVSTQWGTASQACQRTNDRAVIEDGEVFNSWNLPQIPGTLISRSSHGCKVTFRFPVTRSGSSTLC